MFDFDFEERLIAYGTVHLRVVVLTHDNSNDKSCDYLFLFTAKQSVKKGFEAAK